jgi:hypothetical protein
MRRTSSGSDFDVESGDSQLAAAGCDVLGCQHSGVWGGLVTIGLDFHASGNTADGFATTVTYSVST